MLLIQPSPKNLKNYIRYFLLASLLFFALFLAKKYIPNFSNKTLDNTLIFCDAEKVVSDKFQTENHTFGNGNTQSDLQAYSGKYACRLDQKNKYGMSFVLEQPNVGERYKVSVWRYRATAGQSFLAISGTENLKYYKQENRFTIKKENAWELLQTYVSVPKYEGKGSLKFFVYLADAENVFFDDLKIEKIAFDSTTQTVDLVKPLHLTLNENNQKSGGKNEWYIALDYDIPKMFKKWNTPIAKKIKNWLNYIHFPAPTIMISPEIKFYPLYI